MIYIINYGLGNIGSIANMLKKNHVNFLVAENPQDLKCGVTKLILPGVGSFDDGMTLLRTNLWVDLLSELVLEKKVPILGICLGMQLMTMKSEEGHEKGLGWINARVKKFKFDDPTIKIPHMGWNNVSPVNDNSGLFNGLGDDDTRFYHIHSYFVSLEDQCEELAKTNYSGNFTSAFQKENIIGVQFHPEKSHKYGMTLLNNFVKLS